MFKQTQNATRSSKLKIISNQLHAQTFTRKFQPPFRPLESAFGQTLIAKFFSCSILRLLFAVCHTVLRAVYAAIQRKRQRRMQRAMIRDAKEALEDYK